MTSNNRDIGIREEIANLYTYLENHQERAASRNTRIQRTFLRVLRGQTSLFFILALVQIDRDHLNFTVTSIFYKIKFTAHTAWLKKRCHMYSQFRAQNQQETEF